MSKSNRYHVTIREDRVFEVPVEAIDVEEALSRALWLVENGRVEPDTIGIDNENCDVRLST